LSSIFSALSSSLKDRAEEIANKKKHEEEIEREVLVWVLGGDRK